MAKNTDGTKKPIFKKWWFWAIVIVIVVAAAAGSQKPKVVDNTGDTATQEQPADDQKQEEASTEDLAPGTAVDLGDGVTISVDSVETVTNFSGENVVKAVVTYKNGSDDTISYNMYDWKGQDANGAAESSTGFVAQDGSVNDDMLSSGDLSAGGTKTANLYFKDGTVEIQYSGFAFSKDVKASWTVQ